MKYIIAIVGLIFVIAACNQKDNPTPVQNDDTKDKCIKIRSEQFYNGSVIETRSYTYNSKNLLIEEVGIDNQNQKVDSIHYSYDNLDRLERRHLYIFSSGFSLVTTNTYYPDNKLKRSEFSAYGNQPSVNEYFYNQNGEIDSINYVSSNGILSVTKYLYENDTLDEIRKFGESGNLTQRVIYTYKGNITTKITEDGNGEIMYSEKIKVDSNGNEIEWNKYDYNGILQGIRLTEYDARNNVIRFTEIYGQEVYDLVTDWKCPEK